MHELPITKSICDIAVSEGQKRNVKRIFNISICRGEYTDYVPEIVQEYFNLVSRGTIAEGAALIFKDIPAVIYCNECKKESPGGHYKRRCPICNSPDTNLLSGREFYIDSMEVEENGDKDRKADNGME